jgi:heme-degrading monooxygenase HmoA
MYARITRVQSPPERLDDLVNTFTTNALPALRSLPGYAGSSLGIDRSSGDGQAVTFWESAEALKSSETAATGIRNDTVQAGGGKVASVQRLEVALFERFAPATAPAYIRVVRAQGDRTKIDTLVQATRERALPVLRDTHGFRALVIAVDRDSGGSVVTTVWDSPEDREASDAKIDAIRRDLFAMAGATQPPEISRYEVHAVEFVGAAATAG